MKFEVCPCSVHVHLCNLYHTEWRTVQFRGVVYLFILPQGSQSWNLLDCMGQLTRTLLFQWVSVGMNGQTNDAKHTQACTQAHPRLPPNTHIYLRGKKEENESTAVCLKSWPRLSLMLTTIMVMTMIVLSLTIHKAPAISHLFVV